MNMKFGTTSLAGVLGKAKKIPWMVGSRAFAFIMGLIALDLLLGLLLFYNYVVVVQADVPDGIEKNITFDYTDYQKVLRVWQQQDQDFQVFSNSNYPDPFNSR